MSPKKRTRVLYVEDHDDTRDMVALLLRDLTCDVTAVESCAEALAAAKGAKFNLYILDNCLPDGLGTTLCREIRTFDSSSPIILCSGFDDGPHLETAGDAGANILLAKPFDVNDLIDAIDKVTRKK